MYTSSQGEPKCTVFNSQFTDSVPEIMPNLQASQQYYNENFSEKKCRLYGNVNKITRQRTSIAIRGNNYSKIGTHPKSNLNVRRSLFRAVSF